MDYNEMIYGLADEMLEKIAADDDDYGYNDGYYYEDDDYEYITEEDLDYMSDDELEALAEAMYEDELEKTAGIKDIGSGIANGARTARGYVEYGARTGARKLAGKKSRQLMDGAYTKGIDEATAKKLRRKGIGRGVAVGGAKTLGAAGLAGGGAYGVHRFRNKGQEKAAQMYEEAQLYKQAAEETWGEAQAVQDAASLVFDYLDY